MLVRKPWPDIRNVLNKQRLIAAIFLSFSALGVVTESVGSEPDHPDPPRGTIAFSSIGTRHWDLYRQSANSKAAPITHHHALDFNASYSLDGRQIAFASDRDGNVELYVMNVDGSGVKRLTNNLGLDDHPAWSPDGRQIAFVSTREAAPAGQAWNAVYVMNANGAAVRRLSPPEHADYSPAWSPRGDLIAVASGSGNPGQTDIYVMTPEGNERRLVTRNGGWPTFVANGSAIAFHSRREDDRWDVWSVKLDGTNLKEVARGASMPRATADGGKLVVVAHQTPHKQIAVVNIATGVMEVLTDAATDHWNPAISAGGEHVVYHKQNPELTARRNVEVWGGLPRAPLSLIRVAGGFPAFSPDESRLALTAANFGRVDVMNTDGSARRTIYQGKRRSLFGMSWSQKPERVAFSHGVVFAEAGASVRIIAAAPDSDDRDMLTGELGNDGFPSYSPDGQEIVFRSGRDGVKNLYIMQRDGTGVRRLTRGQWTDTMCDWSPTGDLIAFSSDREDDFEIWLIRPDGTDTRKLVGGGGRNTHPHFSPDGKWIVFASQRAGYSAEEVSMPRQPQSYGELFIIRIDGTALTRLTHNGTEEGTPAWGAREVVLPSDAVSTSENEF